MNQARSQAARDIHAEVTERYAAAAQHVSQHLGQLPIVDTAGDCCSAGTVAQLYDGTGAQLYDEEQRSALPTAAVAASLGCGNPTAVADLRPGERVLDLGSGGGIDVLLSAHRVGPDGSVFGLDMTEEMLDLARRNAAEAGTENVTFLRGQIEAIPLPDAAIDVIISNCVINLSPDKAAVLAEAARVLVPGGRLGITDIVAEESLTPKQRAERGSWAGCIAGALTASEYQRLLRDAGFTDIAIERTHEMVPGMSNAMIRAVSNPLGE
jgi:arsenite methyltransferase